MSEAAAELHSNKRVCNILSHVIFVRVKFLDSDDLSVVQIAVVSCHFVRFRVNDSVFDDPCRCNLSQERLDELRQPPALFDEFYLVQSSPLVHIHVDGVDGLDVGSIGVWISVEVG